MTKSIYRIFNVHFPDGDMKQVVAVTLERAVEVACALSGMKKEDVIRVSISDEDGVPKNVPA